LSKRFRGHHNQQTNNENGRNKYYRRNYQPQSNNSEENGGDQQRSRKKVVLQPKNMAQETYIDHLTNTDQTIVFAIGAAGTGKTYLATVYAIGQLRSGACDKIVITRPAVSVEEQHGFLPGTIIDKMQPWVLPILDYFYEYYGKKEVLSMLEDGVIEIAPLSYMRGRTFKNCIIIADEMQNSTPNQMKMLLTRIGEDCRLIVTGDVEQHDRGYEENGLRDFTRRYDGQRGISVCRFAYKDVERHPLIEVILGLYK
jgi:phosphate starvation-inducible PhoH-like protein